MEEQKFNSVYNDDGSNSIAKSLLGIIVFSFLVAMALVVGFFMFI